MLRKRPYLTVEMCRAVIEAPLDTSVQDDGRLRFWAEVTLPGGPEARILRVVTLEDGTTIHNAFIDRGFARETT